MAQTVVRYKIDIGAGKHQLGEVCVPKDCDHAQLCTLIQKDIGKEFKWFPADATVKLDAPLWNGQSRVTVTGASNKSISYGGFSVQASTLMGRRYQILVEDWYTIRRVKEVIHDQAGIPVDQQRLVWAGQLLEDHRLVSHYNLQKDATIHVILNLRGNGHPDQAWVDQELKKSNPELYFSESKLAFARQDGDESLSLQIRSGVVAGGYWHMEVPFVIAGTLQQFFHVTCNGKDWPLEAGKTSIQYRTITYVPKTNFPPGSVIKWTVAKHKLANVNGLALKHDFIHEYHVPASRPFYASILATKTDIVCMRQTPDFLAELKQDLIAGNEKHIVTDIRMNNIHITTSAQVALLQSGDVLEYDVRIESDQCVICLERPAVRLSRNSAAACGHVCLCYQCPLQATCPICRQ